MKDILQKGFSELSIPYSEETYIKLKQFTALLLNYNEKINLTSIIKEEDIAIKHYLDSLTLFPFLDRQKSLIDVGTGAGFPGIILKIVGYEGKITLLDSLRKRINFLDEVITYFKLTQIETLHSRAEDGGRDKNYREKYHYATARAVAPLSILCEYCLPFVEKGGQFIAMKANIEEDASTSIRKLGGRLKESRKIVLPFSDYDRTLLFIDKTEKTPDIYPRKAGTPEKRPL
ncbi:MAG: 16S rRNA (guanine(527)-N(7))-methyltransferase RsmG [Clostridia bacterium]|nr:16S rRNA (guanine(527)-N(7))-methyltransferase RsmG [Clostridia bacterium]